MGSTSSMPRDPHPLWPLALFRMLFGLMYLHMALQKAPWVITDGERFGWLYGFIWKQINHPTFDWYAVFLKGVVLPYFTLFGALSFLTEIGLGLGLFIGLFTPLVGLGGALWMVNIAVGSFSIPEEWPWIWMLLIVPQVVFALSRAGRPLGLDAVVAQKVAERVVGGGKVPRWARYLA